MTRSLPFAMLALLAASPHAATAQAPAAYDVAETDIGTLLDDPAARSVIDRRIPGFSTNAQVDMARSMTLAALQRNAPERISARTLAEIQVDLARLPRK